MKKMTYTERASLCVNPLASKLLRLLDTKKTNLALSADVTSASALVDLADRLGPEICVLKTHIDIIQDFTPALTQQLRSLALKHQFFLFEDRKFADIGQTVKQQYAGGIYQIAAWADIINAHSLPGPGIIAGLATASTEKERGLLLLAEMSSADNLLNTEYVEKTLAMAEQYPAFVIGFIAQRKLNIDPRWIYLTPGVQLEKNADDLGQCYNTPEQVITKQESDIIIVGRGILNAPDPLAAAKLYREQAWAAYQRRSFETVRSPSSG